MKRLSRIMSIILISITVIILIASVGSTIMKKPFLLTVIRSNSMYPLVERGDMVLLQPLSEQQPKEMGDIVIFKSEEGRLASQGWVFHRIVDGNPQEGFVTQGDANERSDQVDGAPPIKTTEVAGRAIVLGDQPLKVPLVGFLSLWLEDFQKNSFSLPIMAIALAVILAGNELLCIKKRKKKKRKKKYLELPLLYFLSGLTIVIMMAATILATGQHITVPYEVSKDSSGVLMGSAVGIIPVGEVIEKELVDLSSDGFFPMVASITTTDPQITFSHDSLTTVKGQETQVTMKLTATTPGKYNSKIHVGMFMPLLPKNMIHSLCKVNYWLALGVISFIPGIPLMIYPLLDKNLRRKTRKGLRQAFRNVRKSMPI